MRYPAPASAHLAIVWSFFRKFIPGTKTRYARNGHSATDIPPKTRGRDGDVLVAAWDGILHYVDFDSDKNPHRGPLGLQISIEAHDGKGAYYAHLADRIVPDGVRVKAGDPVALMGHTGITGKGGASTHLHFEILAKWNDWRTPLDFFNELEAARKNQPTPAPKPKEDDMSKLVAITYAGSPGGAIWTVEQRFTISFGSSQDTWLTDGDTKWKWPHKRDDERLRQLQSHHVVSSLRVVGSEHTLTEIPDASYYRRPVFSSEMFAQLWAAGIIDRVEVLSVDTVLTLPLRTLT